MPTKAWPAPPDRGDLSVIRSYVTWLSPLRHGLRRLAEEISVTLDLRTLRELQPLEELRQRLRSTDQGF